MRKTERVVMRRKLDAEQKYFQTAERHGPYETRWLKRVRLVLGVHAVDMAAELGVNPSVIFRLEESEERQTISMQALQKLAETMGCQVVYAVVPRGGKTLAELAEWQEWTRRLGSRD
jgi:transcriptional regulator with XRE-family HTH domain